MRVNIARDKKAAFHPVNAHRMKNYETITTPLNPSSKPKIKVSFILYPYHFDGSLPAI